MNQKIVSVFGSLLALLLLANLAIAQAASSQPSAAPPVSYASVSQLNSMLNQLEQASQSVQGDLSKLRIDHWKTDSNSKRQSTADVESIQRNLQGALPAIIGELRAAPESLPSTFKLYRNLDALYDVFGSVVESAGAFGPKDDFQSLENDLATIEKSRHAFADRMASLAENKENEVSRLRAQLQTAQSAASPSQPKKIIVDDTVPSPPKKSAKKKPVHKAPAPTSSTATPAPKQ